MGLSSRFFFRVTTQGMAKAVALESKLPKLTGNPYTYWTVPGVSQCVQLFCDQAAARDAIKALPAPAPTLAHPCASLHSHHKECVCCVRLYHCNGNPLNKPGCANRCPIR